MWIAACAHATSKSRHLVAFRQCSGMFSIQRGWAQQALAAEPSARHHQHTQPALPATALLPQPQRASILRLLGGQHARALQLPPPEAAGTALAPQPAQERFFASKRASKGPATPPDLLNKTFTFDSVTVKKVRARKDRGWASLSVTLTPEQWSSLEPSLQQAVRWRRAQGAAINTNTAIAHQMMKSRTISMRGYGLSKIGEGCMMWVQGTWRSNDMVGMELEISSFQELEITCLQALQKRLESMLEGAGPTTAKLLVDKYGTSVFDMLKQPDAVQKMIAAGVTKARAHTIKKSYTAAMGEHQAEEWFADLGLPPYIIEAVIGRYGPEDAKARIKDDPYTALLDMPNFDFDMADHIARQLSRSPELPSRGYAALYHTLLKDLSNGGHTFMTWHSLKQALQKTLTHSDTEWAKHYQNNRQQSPSPAPPGVTSPMSAAARATSPAPAAARAMSPAAQIGNFRLASETFRRAQNWATQLMRKDLIVVEEVTDIHTPPVRMPKHDTTQDAQDTSPVDAQPTAAPKARVWPDTAMVYPVGLYEAENIVSSTLARLLSRVPEALRPKPGQSTVSASSLESDVTRRVHGWVTQQQIRTGGNIELTDKQIEAMHLSALAPVMLLTGAAGCGKTFSTKAIISVLRQEGKEILLCAPTGRAAQRLQEAGAEFGLTASTVHRALGYKPKGDVIKPSDIAAGVADAARDASASSTSGNAGEASTNSQSDAGSTTVVPRSSGRSDIDMMREELFEFNSTNRLPYHAVLVDEASMLDVSVAAALMRALHDDTHLILIGDPNQLPPVGSGAVLKDMLASALFPRVHLDQIFRQSQDSNIVAGAHHVMNSRSPVIDLTVASLPANTHQAQTVTTAASDTASAPGPGPDGSHMRGMPRVALPDVLNTLEWLGQQTEHHLGRGSPGRSVCTPLMRKAGEAMSQDELESQQAIAAIRGALGSDGVVMLQQGSDTDMAQDVVQLVQGLAQAGVDITADVQVLSATWKHKIGVGELNKVLQPLMNPDIASGRIQPPPARGLQIRQGDRVVQVENDYDRDVFNGDLGTVLPTTTQERKEDIIRVKFAARPNSQDQDSHIVTYQGKEQFQLQLGWATTVHKAQGGEYPVVIMVLHDQVAKSLLKRTLLYTAITRGKQLLFLLSSPSALDNATHKSYEALRNTLLAPRTQVELRQIAKEPVASEAGEESGTQGVTLQRTRRRAMPTGPSPRPAAARATVPQPAAAAAVSPRQAPAPAAAAALQPVSPRPAPPRAGSVGRAPAPTGPSPRPAAQAAQATQVAATTPTAAAATLPPQPLQRSSSPVQPPRPAAAQQPASAVPQQPAQTPQAQQLQPAQPLQPQQPQRSTTQHLTDSGYFNDVMTRLPTLQGLQGNNGVTSSADSVPVPAAQPAMPVSPRRRGRRAAYTTQAAGAAPAPTADSQYLQQRPQPPVTAQQPAATAPQPAVAAPQQPMQTGGLRPARGRPRQMSSPYPAFPSPATQQPQQPVPYTAVQPQSAYPTTQAPVYGNQGPYNQSPVYDASPQQHSGGQSGLYGGSSGMIADVSYVDADGRAYNGNGHGNMAYDSSGTNGVGGVVYGSGNGAGPYLSSSSNSSGNGRNVHGGVVEQTGPVPGPDRGSLAAFVRVTGKRAQAGTDGSSK